MIELMNSSAGGNDSAFRWCATLSAYVLESVHHGEAIDNLTEDHVVVVEPRSRGECDEKLRAVRVRSVVGHGKQVAPTMVELEAFIFELEAVDALTTSAVPSREIPTLGHEAWNDSMERGPCVVHFCTKFSNPGFSICNGREVVHSARQIVTKESKNDPSDRLLVNMNVEEDFVCDHSNSMAIKSVIRVRANSRCQKQARNQSIHHF